MSLRLPDPLWLRFTRTTDLSTASNISAIYCRNQTATSPLATACTELASSLTIILGRLVPLLDVVDRDAMLHVQAAEEYALFNSTSSVTLESFMIKKNDNCGNFRCTTLSSPTGRGALYGAFRLLMLLQRGVETLPTLIEDTPRSRLRIWQGWDNVDGTIERGYGGRSIFHFEELPAVMRPRYAAYARLLASVGLNAISLTNVNACERGNERLLDNAHIAKAARLAATFARYGLSTFLTPCYASPMLIGGLPTADPLDTSVRHWWVTSAATTAAEFAAATRPRSVDQYPYPSPSPFGGYLIKADSEGEPGPGNYNRSEPEGASVLADALRPFGGLVLWRAFTHPGNLGRNSTRADQPLAQYTHFKALDGLWPANVVLQIKNGPMDFQVHEPVHSLFGKIEHTNVLLELGVAHEYTGQAWHLAHLPAQWSSYLGFDTRCGGHLPLWRVVTEGSGYGFAGVSNFGEDQSWTGHLMSAANTFGFGRLAWDATLSAEQLAKEWSELTWGCDPRVTKAVTTMLGSSWHVFESFASPFGIGATCANCHAFGGFCGNSSQQVGVMPPPKSDHYYLNFSAWRGAGKPPNAGYGGGFNLSVVDRTIGNNRSLAYGATYCGENKAIFADPQRTPESLLLTFHHLPWDYLLPAEHGPSADVKEQRLLLPSILAAYARGVDQTSDYVGTWAALEGLPGVDALRHAAVKERLLVGAADAGNFSASAIRFFTAAVRLATSIERGAA